MRVVDIYCGAGGFSEGFRQAGFNIIWGIDNWQCAIDTFLGNNPSSKAIKDNVIRISLLDEENFNKTIPDSEIIIGSPPCIAFSNSNKSGKADKFKGIELIEAYLRIIARKKFKKNSTLKFWILENVPKSEPFIKDIYSTKELGLEFDHTLRVKNSSCAVYSAQKFGVPSKRLRYFCGEFPTPEVKIKNDTYFIPLKKIISQLKQPNNDLEEVIQDPNYNYSLISRDVTDHHYIIPLSDFEWRTSKRLKEDKGYMGKMSFPENINKPARTIMATLAHTSREAFILKLNGIYRSPTIREVASLMSFPLDYRFYGISPSTKYRLVGNAVPPKLAFAFAEAIKKKENLRVLRKYRPLTYNEQIDFINLNGDIFHKMDEKPKPKNSKFKYHIPYLILNSFRVELTNYHSKFSKNKFRWNVELHRSCGPNAKVFNVNANKINFSSLDRKIIVEYLTKIKPSLTNHNEFQKIYCLKERDRKSKRLIGPYELLESIKIYLYKKSSRFLSRTLLIKNIKYEIPIIILIGYKILSEIIKLMEQQNE